MPSPATRKSQPVSTTAPHALRYAFFRSIDAAGADWDAAAPADNLFLQRAYLNILEKNPPEGMQFGYLVFYCDQTPAGVALCQFKHFRADDSLQDLTENTGKDPCFFTAVSAWLKRRVAGLVSTNILICGNMLLTGEHGYFFQPHLVAGQDIAPALESALNEVVKMMDRDGMKLSFVLVKDVPPQQELARNGLAKKQFVEFCIQPNMVMSLQGFHTYDDYMQAMSTKYRTRAKRAFKKAEGLEKRELSLAEVQRHLPEIYALYKDIARQAGFNMVDLNEHYLLALKRDFGAHFRMFGYFNNGQLKAFYTTICNHHQLESHFLGFDKSLNHDRQVYLNILYDIVRVGIESGCSEIVFARTALEIKSSVGAVPHDLYCYLRNQNTLANQFTGALLGYLKPEEDWLPRHPFKEGHD
jgi:hypothetical protein